MGLSSLPAPSEGMLCIILVNTAISLSIFKALLRSILHLIGIHLPSPESIEIPSPTSSEPLEYCLPPPIEEIRKTIPSSLYSSISNCIWSDEPDCSVCLARFKPHSQVSNLPCAHVFHKLCLEKWLDYCNFTCPLCRTPLTPLHHQDLQLDPLCHCFLVFMVSAYKSPIILLCSA
ncbi:hypothetical protein Syun_026728 [Stephania yunnanensis]|uniref:RING-type domain-containing protein n=1 Tax=Stephania yunnanensis TaxID=152371 RepID=A0AAP0EJC1_9MAGN